MLLLLVAIPLAVAAQRTESFTYNGTPYSYTAYFTNDTLATDYWRYLNTNPHSGIFVVTTQYPFNGTYNCHALAWPHDTGVWVESQNGNNSSAPQVYWSSGYYSTAASESEAEIAVYGNQNSPTHSAVRLTNSSNPVAQSFLALYPQYAGWWISKWDGGPLVIHRLDSCPFYISSQPPVLYRKTAEAGKNHINAANFVIRPASAGQAGVVCAGGTQFILGYAIGGDTVNITSPVSFTVTWGATGSISIANTTAYPVTATATGSGTGTITATLYFPDGTSGAAVAYPVWIGMPTAITSISTSQWSAGGLSYQTITVSKSGAYFYGWPFNQADVNQPTAIDSHGANSYSWTCSPSIFTQQQNSTNRRYAYGGFSASGLATIYIHASNGCGTTSAYQAINVSSTMLDYDLSPNPANTFVGVSVHPSHYGVAADLGTTNTYVVRIVDALGKTWYTGQHTGTTLTIPTATLRPGTYWLILQTGTGAAAKQGSKPFMIVR